ncbi:MAG TPA: hypothetical protein VN612_09500 [Acidobacteriaceae bacterium]|nr:hypothetical protein [Acidobacteriaceae bacterium]
MRTREAISPVVSRGYVPFARSAHLKHQDTKSWYRPRPGSPCWAIALLLAFAVSVWGLHYKLSLYQPSASKAHAPAAKLLSQKERPAAAVYLEAGTDKPSNPVLFGSAPNAFATLRVAALAGKRPEQWILAIPETIVPPSAAFETQLLAPRPPPSIA